MIARVGGREEKARETIRRILEDVPHFNMEFARRGAPYKSSEDLHKYLDAIRRAGLPEG